LGLKRAIGPQTRFDLRHERAGVRQWPLTGGLPSFSGGRADKHADDEKNQACHFRLAGSRPSTDR